MYLSRLVVLALSMSVVSAPLAAQGIPRGARTAQKVANAPRLMVANPFAFAPGDSANAVRLGSAMRQEMKDIVGRNYTVIEQSQMNDALKQYGYPIDAILSPPLATTLAKNIQARVILTGTLAKAEGGRTTVTARLIGVNDDAGNVVTLAQQQGQSLDDFGKRIAKALGPAVKSLPDAKECVDQQTAKPDKAEDAAKKAIKVLPNNGLAHFCLAQLAKAQKKPAEVVQQLQAAVKGDPLSLAAWTALAEQYQASNDTANTLVAFKQMLRVAPTNQALRERLFKYFLASGHPETAREVADEGLKLDPYNADLYDLKSNACLFLSDFKCAVDALETMYATDSTKADTLFFSKISVAAQEGKDANRLVKWSQLGTRKYPNNATLLRYLNAGYAMAGQTDSLISVTRRIIARDTTETGVDAALAAAKALILPPTQDTAGQRRESASGSAQRDTAARSSADTATRSSASADTTSRSSADTASRAAAGQVTPTGTSSDTSGFTPRPKEALPFLEFAIQHGDADAKETAAVLLYSGATPLLQQPQDLQGAEQLLRLAVQTANPGGKVYPAANYLLGLATLFQVPQIDPQAEKQKSCELAKQEQGLLAASDSALTAGRSVNPQAVQKNLDIIKKYQPRIASMLKAYCKEGRKKKA
jgi:tetratricopeptide (TPR) repeat protein